MAQIHRMLSLNIARPIPIKAEQMGLWIQTCNYPIYDFGAVAKGEKVLTTCASDLVVSKRQVALHTISSGNRRREGQEKG